MNRPLSSAEITRQAILSATIQLIGDKGYDAVSTREIADLAAANIGSIAYHFGGKPGLRTACANHVVGEIRELIGMGLGAPKTDLAPAKALHALEDTIRIFCRFWLSRPDTQIYVNYILRELVETNEIASIFYEGWIRPMHMQLCALFGVATGKDPESEDVKIATFSFVGQIFHFRVGKSLVMRRLGWQTIGEEEASRINDSMVRTLRAMVESHSQGD